MRFLTLIFLVAVIFSSIFAGSVIKVTTTVKGPGGTNTKTDTLTGTGTLDPQEQTQAGSSIKHRLGSSRKGN